MLSKKSKTKKGRAGPQALQVPGRPDALILVNGTDIDVRKVLQEGWQGTHNAQRVVGDVLLERAWERLKSRQLHSFLSEINAKGSLTLTKTEVLQGVEQVKCSTCQSALREAASRAFEETKPQHICQSVKATCPTAAAGGAKGPTGEPTLHFGNSITPNALAQLKQFVVTSGEAGSVQEKEETKATHAHMNGGDGGGGGGDKEDATAGLLSGGSSANGSVMVVNEFCLQDMLVNLKTLQSSMLELSVALQSQMAQDGKSGVATQTLDWAPNRAFTQIFPQMENAFKHWMHQMANLILRLSKIEALSVVLDSDDRKLIKEMMTELWNRFEAAMENILEATAKGRQEQLKDLPASAHPIFFTLGAMSSKARGVAQKTLQRKRKHMEDLQTFVSRQLEEGTRTRDLVEQLWALPEQLEFFSGSEWAALDQQESEALSVRMHICTEGAMISSRQEVVQSESAVESHLKRVLTDWEALLDRHYEHLRTALKEDLSHERFPQTVEMATDIEVQFKEFHDEWENQLAAYQFQARLSQDKLSGLNLEAHRRKLLLKDKAEKGKAGKSGSTPTVVYLNGDIVTDGDDDESQRQLAAAIHQAQQQQIEQCLRFRIFAAKNYLVRQRLLREVTATIRWLLARKPELTQRLCGGEAEANGKLRLLLGRMMLEKLERLCGEWQAEVVERELVADEARADEKRRKARARIQSQNQQAQKPRKAQTGKSEEVSGQEGQAEELLVEVAFVPVNGVAERVAPEAVVPSVNVEREPDAVIVDADGFNVLDYDPSVEVDGDQGWTTVAPKEKERGRASKRRGGKGGEGLLMNKGSWKLERTSARGKDRDQGDKAPKAMAAHATEATAAPPAPLTEPSSAPVSVREGDGAPAGVRQHLPPPPPVEEEKPGVSASGEEQVVLEMSEEQWPQLPAAEDSMRQHPVVELSHLRDAATPPPPPPRPDAVKESLEGQPHPSLAPPTTRPPQQQQAEEPELSSAVETEVPMSAEAGEEVWMEQPQTELPSHEAELPPQDEEPVVEEEEDSDSDVEIMFGDLGPEPSADAVEEGEEGVVERGFEAEQVDAAVEEQQRVASIGVAPEHMEPATMPPSQVPEGPHAPAPATGERPPQAVDAAQQQMYMAPPPPYYYQPNPGAGPPSFDGGMHMGLPPHMLPTGPDGAPLHHGHMGPPHGYTPHYAGMYGHALQHGQHYPMDMQQMQAYHQHQQGPHQPHARPPQQHYYPPQTAARPHMPANAGGRGQSRGGFRGQPGGYEQHQQHQQHHHGMDQSMMKAGVGQTGGGYGIPQYYGSPHHYQHQHQHHHHQQQHQMPNAGANPYVGYGKKGSPELSPYQPVPQRGMGPHAHTHRGTTHHTPSPPHRSRNYSQGGGGRGSGRVNQQQPQYARTWRSVPPEAERAGEPEDGEKEDRTDAVNPGEVPSSSRSPESEDAEPEVSASESLDGKAIAPDEPPRTPLRVEENRARVPLPIRVASREGVEGAHTHTPVPPPVEVTSSSFSSAAPTRGRKKNKSPTPTSSSSSSSSQGPTHTRSRETSSVSPERVDSNSIGGSNGASAQAAGKEPLPAGLTNRTGQNHCFLNVVVQSLWSLRAFRDRVCRASSSSVGDGGVGGWGEGGGSVTSSSAGRVETELKAVFEGLSRLEGWEGSTESPRSVSVDGLRQMLSELAGKKAKFCAGHMDDAVEAFEEILGFLIEGGGEGRRAVEDSFCLHMREIMLCPGCGHTSPNPPREYDTNIFYVPVRSLMEVAARMGVGMGGVDRIGFDRLLQGAGSGDLYSCSTPGCMLARRGEKRAGHRYLVHQPPRVFCLGLVWDSLKGDSREIQRLMGLIEPHVKLDSLLLQTAEESVGRSVNGGGNRVSTGGTGGGMSGGRGGLATGAALRGFFAFHPQKHHYVAFLYHHASGRWICLDDSEVKVLGPSHLDALKHCVECQYQPSLLFYEIQAPSAPPMVIPTSSSSSSSPSASAQLKAVTLESGDGRVRMSAAGHA